MEELLSLQIPSGPDDPFVSTVRVYKFTHEMFRMNKDNGLMAFTYRYDRERRLVEQITYGPHENELDRLRFVYDGEGKLVEKETYNEGQLAEAEKYQYDEQGQMVRCEIYYSGELGSVVLNQWNSDGLVVEIRTEDDEGELEELVQRNYGERDLLLEELHTYSWGGQASFKYTYDEEGRELNVKGVDGDGNLVRNSDKTYDAEGNLKTYSFRDFGTGEAFDSQHSLTEENGRAIRLVELSDGSVQKVVMTGDLNSVAEEFIIFGPDKGIRLQQSFRYENGLRKEETYFRRGVDHFQLGYEYDFFD